MLDNDSDGIANYVDLDSDGDGVKDVDDHDWNGDGKSDDLDTDGDGISDREDFDDNIGSICHERQSTRTLSVGKVCYECATSVLRDF